MKYITVNVDHHDPRIAGKVLEVKHIYPFNMALCTAIGGQEHFLLKGGEYRDSTSEIEEMLT